MTFNRSSFALGVLFALVIIGCTVAVTVDPEKGDDARYEFIDVEQYRYEAVGNNTQIQGYAVFDRDTGTVNIIDKHGILAKVHNFATSPVD